MWKSCFHTCDQPHCSAFCLADHWSGCFGVDAAPGSSACGRQQGTMSSTTSAPLRTCLSHTAAGSTSRLALVALLSRAPAAKADMPGIYTLLRHAHILAVAQLGVAVPGLHTEQQDRKRMYSTQLAAQLRTATPAASVAQVCIYMCYLALNHQSACCFPGMQNFLGRQGNGTAVIWQVPGTALVCKDAAHLTA